MANCTFIIRHGAETGRTETLQAGILHTEQGCELISATSVSFCLFVFAGGWEGVVFGPVANSAKIMFCTRVGGRTMTPTCVLIMCPPPPTTTTTTTIWSDLLLCRQNGSEQTKHVSIAYFDPLDDNIVRRLLLIISFDMFGSLFFISYFQRKRRGQ